MLLQDVADRLAMSHKILVITGAGISTSCGIPVSTGLTIWDFEIDNSVQDFRSKDGLYNIIPEQSPTPTSSVPSTPSKCRFSSEGHFPSSQSPTTHTSNRRSSSSPTSKLKGQDLFDASVWKASHTTEVFYRFIASLRQKIQEEVSETSQAHKFIRTLRDGGRLMRCYTQNIDGLERREGLSMDLDRGKGTRRRFKKQIWQAPRPNRPRHSDADGGCEVVPLHGDLEVLRCTLCQETCSWSEEATGHFLNGQAPACPRCATKSCDRQERGKRGVAIGSLRPNIVLYGEEHPSNHSLAPLIPFDLGSGPEILIIMGTSLKVHGLQKIVKEFAKKIHARKDGKGKVFFVNRTKPAESMWENVIDSYVAMDCDSWVWDLRKRRKDLWLRQGDLNLKVTKSATRKRKSTVDLSMPPKRERIAVEIPVKQGSTKTTLSRKKITRTTPSPAMLTPPPSRGQGTALGVEAAPTLEPHTSRRTLNFSFKRNMYDNPFRRIFLSPVHPHMSPLRNTWKPSFEAAEGGGVSPQRPPFSPIEKTCKKLNVYEDREVEIEESQDEEQEEDLRVPETPTKARPLRPRSDSSLNSELAMGGSMHESKGDLPLNVELIEHMPRRRKRMSVSVA